MVGDLWKREVKQVYLLANQLIPPYIKICFLIKDLIEILFLLLNLVIYIKLNFFNQFSQDE